MRCTSCGLPLSPARTVTSCPRCGTPIVSEKKSSSSPVQQPFSQVTTSPPESVPWKQVAPQTQLPEVEQSPMAHPGGREEIDRHSASSAHGPYRSDLFQSTGAHVHSPVTFPPASPTYMPQPAPQLDPLWLPMSASDGYKGSHIQQPQVQEHGEAGRGRLQPREQLMGDLRLDRTPDVAAPLHSELFSASPQDGSWQPVGARADQAAMGMKEFKRAPAELPLRPLRGSVAEAVGTIRPIRSGKHNLGFIAAGLCVMMGGLILVFVYFMAIGLPGSSTGTNTVKTHTATNSSPISASSSTSSPTATSFPGQKYIDSAQLASSIDPTSHQAIQVTTMFKAKQSIYITFQVHPAGQSGAACLLWYANNKEFFSYQLPVYPNERTTYSYASYGGTGSGYVEIYWASTTRCTDKILAQHVNFTVST